MLAQLQFYLRHSFNDLRVSKRLAAFALLSIAAGVAAIVSLQTLVVMISDSLEQNLQETNRGDISVLFEPGDDGEDIEAAAEAGLLNENELSFFGQTESEFTISQQGIDALQNWIDESGYNAEFTYRMHMAGVFGIITSSGIGTSLTDMESGDQVSQLTPVVIDPANYPYYSSIAIKEDLLLLDVLRNKEEILLADVLQNPTDIVIGENIATDLEIEIGDAVQVNGSDETYTVRGIVTSDQEVKNAESDFFAGLFGFYYLHWDAINHFEEIEPQTSTLFFRLDDPAQLQDFNTGLKEAFPFLDTTTTDDLRQENEEIMEQIGQLMTIMGLVSLLIGSIGIVNTMQVIVRRRMLEIAVLKTIGLQAEQVTILFIVEAFLMGIVGSLAGVLLGWFGTFALKGIAEAIFGSGLPFRLAVMPVVNGVVVGILVTTVFGFLPTLAAGQVRPGIVLQPSQGVLPRAGRLRTIGALLAIIIVISLIVTTILDSVLMAFAVVAGAFAAAGVIYGLLWVLIWLIGRFMPSFGFIDLKISLRQMQVGRGRGASTLLALVVGVFSLSLITLFAQSINNILTSALEGAGGNVLVSIQGYDRLAEVEEVINGLDGVNDYTVSLSYSTELVNFEDAETGTSYDAEAVQQLLRDSDVNFPPFFNGTPEEKDEIQQAILESMMVTPVIEAHDVTKESDGSFVSGRDLTIEDAGLPYLVIQEQEILNVLGLSTGDKLTYLIEEQGLFSSKSEEVTFEIIGIKAETIQINTSSGIYAPAGAFPDDIAPSAVAMFVDINEENKPDLRRALADIPGTFSIDTNVIARFIASLISTFTAFPSMVAALGLVVGGVVIANSVALATMERQREIAVMKAVGLQRERVLGMLLLENAILGFVGGLFGVGIGIIAMIALAQTSGSPLSTVPFGTAFLLMLLCVIVALVAALTSAWGASGEKPLTVLRYE